MAFALKTLLQVKVRHSAQGRPGFSPDPDFDEPTVSFANSQSSSKSLAQSGCVLAGWAEFPRQASADFKKSELFLTTHLTFSIVMIEIRAG